MNHDPNPLLNADWLARLNSFGKLIVGFSGGLDSTVLLHALAAQPSLRTKLVAVHINHGISSNASSWQQHCAQCCHDLGIQFITESVQFDRSANIEEHARIARYAIFASLLTTKDCLILGHHQDDQAETVLLQLFRGAGIDGLAAMTAVSHLGAGTLVRPFLTYSRLQLAHYATVHQLIWIEDESNQEITYSRNYLRQQIMPLLVEKWPGVVGTIARSALHCQQAKSNLDALATQDIEGGSELITLTSTSLCIDPLLNLNFARIANILRVWLRNNQVQLPSTATFHRLINELLYARTDAAPAVSWGDILIRRYQKYLYLDRKTSATLPACSVWSVFPAPLTLEDAGINLCAKKAEQGLVIPPGAKLEIRFRQGGEAFFWHGQSKQLKKLFQEWGVPPWQRARTPLVYINEQLAAVIGYAISDLFFSSSPAWQLSTSSVFTHKND
ncbi:tRNA lysidine(34) synthetase TilS [Legionella drancourtii]|uniref:tRNA(Ile)-lysidine synthase n=1 Tax=Legionella drancourtii LLAP12 TaxID=658187 RepID=G9EJA5_9GAMM|nr:tRNA lysidine(34) synthetase TilS [Legionella drancourtii]EHL32671.1 cell cycle protein MesJ [Legionella drancourtii LLAP12]